MFYIYIICHVLCYLIIVIVIMKQLITILIIQYIVHTKSIFYLVYVYFFYVWYEGYIPDIILDVNHNLAMTKI